MFKDKIKLSDIKSIVLFTFAWPVAWTKRLKHKDLWLLSERHGEARDNGYWMYKYIKENVPEQDACYVIDGTAKDRQKIEKYGSVVTFGSFKHYVTYLTATKHISAHVDADSPNSRVSNFLETHGLLKNKRVFLQHGITKDKISFGYYNVSRADLFVCAAKPEYEFCKEEFGYPDGAVKLLGFARFDGLGAAKPKRQILLMPTWRAWLANVTEEKFKESEYFRTYQSLINNARLHKILADSDIKLFFYPHSDMQKFISLFAVTDTNIQIASSAEHDVQELMNQSAMLITDYSSVAFDMAYMDRPVVYYQFDYEEYRRGQHPEGYYSYENDGFGPVCKSEADLIGYIIEVANNGFATSEPYKQRQDRFFSSRDDNNCKRIYRAIKEL